MNQNDQTWHLCLRIHIRRRRRQGRRSESVRRRSLHHHVSGGWISGLNRNAGREVSGPALVGHFGVLGLLVVGRFVRIAVLLGGVAISVRFFRARVRIFFRLLRLVRPLDRLQNVPVFELLDGNEQWRRRRRSAGSGALLPLHPELVELEINVARHRRVLNPGSIHRNGLAYCNSI